MPTTNADFAVLASAARTTAQSEGPFSGAGARGIMLMLNVTVASGTGGLQVALAAVNPATGALHQVGPLPTAVTATGKKSYVYYPASGLVTTGDITALIIGALPQTFQVTVTVGDASSYTYSLGYSLLY